MQKQLKKTSNGLEKPSEDLEIRRLEIVGHPPGPSRGRPAFNEGAERAQRQWACDAGRKDEARHA